MFRVIPDLIGALRAVLPPWAFALAMVAAAVALAPVYLYWLRSRKVKSLLRRYGWASTDAERRVLADEALELGAKHHRVMVTLADESLRLGMKPIFDRALGALEASGDAPEDVKRLRGKAFPDKPAPMHPVEEAVHVERMLEQGMLEPARARLDRALARFPIDPDLVELDGRLRTAEAANGAPAEHAG